MSQQIPNKISEVEAKEFLRKVLNTVPDVQPEDINSLMDLFSLESSKKNTIVINEGQIADYIYFIYKGVVRVYFFKNDKIVIERFEKEGGFFGGNFTHLTKVQGTHIYETLEDSILLKIKYSELNELCKRNHGVEHLYRVFMEIFHNSYVNRLFSFKSLSSEERYNEFVEQYGDIANRISLRNIANYLGMTSETLSRIRSKYDKKS